MNNKSYESSVRIIQMVIVIVIIILFVVIVIFHSEQKLREKASRDSVFIKVDSLNDLTDSLSNHIEREEIEASIQSLSWGIPMQDIDELSFAIYEHGQKHNIDPLLLVSLAYHESSFRKYAISRVGCLGYFQLNLKVHVLDKTKIYDEAYQAEHACRILKGKMSCLGLENALNSYNGWVSPHNEFGRNVIALYNKIRRGLTSTTII